MAKKTVDSIMDTRIYETSKGSKVLLTNIEGKELEILLEGRTLENMKIVRDGENKKRLILSLNTTPQGEG